MLQDFDFKTMHCLGPKHVKLMWMRLTVNHNPVGLAEEMRIFCKDPRCASIEKVGDTNLDWEEHMGCRVLMWHHYM
jgi:hypothetical protein